MNKINTNKLFRNIMCFSAILFSLLSLISLSYYGPFYLLEGDYLSVFIKSFLFNGIGGSLFCISIYNLIKKFKNCALYVKIISIIYSFLYIYFMLCGYVSIYILLIVIYNLFFIYKIFSCKNANYDLKNILSLALFLIYMFIVIIVFLLNICNLHVNSADINNFEATSITYYYSFIFIAYILFTLMIFIKIYNKNKKHID